MSKADVKKIVKKYAKNLHKSDFPFSAIYLFGSHVTGKARKWSDIDVAVILPEVKDRLKLEVDLRLKSISIDERINPFVFSQKELQDNSPLIWEIKKYGKKI